MATIADRTLALCPVKWTDVREAAQLFPAHETGAMSSVLEDLERAGKIETRIHGSPPRVQIRRVAAGA